jgi:hypothetical protein
VPLQWLADATNNQTTLRLAEVIVQKTASAQKPNNSLRMQVFGRSGEASPKVYYDDNKYLSVKLSKWFYW